MDQKFEVAYKAMIARKKIEIPFRGEEKRNFERFLDAKGLKAGPWLRVKIIEWMDEASHV